MSSRFVAGMTIEAAVAATQQLNAEGLAVSLDSLGESVSEESQARASAEIYHRLLDEIEGRGLNANVSLKLSQMGLEVPSDGVRELKEPAFRGSQWGMKLAENIVREIVEHAARIGSFVRIDMEGSSYTEVTIALTERIHADFPGRVGTVLQAYLYRTEQDVERLLGQGIRIRLCKGAYREPPEIAFPAKADVDANYVKLMKRVVLVAHGEAPVFCGIATHDEAIVETMRAFVRERGLAPEAFEFQMLYGVRRDLQRGLRAEGFGVRVYVPFGTEWYPYFMRRLAERPANVIFLAKNFFRGV